MVQDLCLVNEAVFPSAPIVPNPSTILSEILPYSSYFSIIDLANAFFLYSSASRKQILVLFLFQSEVLSVECDATGLH